MALCEEKNATSWLGVALAALDKKLRENTQFELMNIQDELGITFVAYSPLGRGFLTGKIRSPERSTRGVRASPAQANMPHR